MQALIQGFAALPDTRLHYEIYGDGPPLLLFHGNGEDLHIFDKMLEPLSRVRRLIAVDTRGHGQSGRGEKPFDFFTFAADMIQLMDLLQLSSADVLGFSDGGNIALHMGILYPDRITRLVLLGANLSTKGVKPSAQIPIALGYAAVRGVAAVNRGVTLKREILGLMVHHPHLEPEALGVIPCPALVVAGERDIIKREHTALIARSLPQGRLLIVPDAGHNIPAKPESLLPPLLEFLNENI